MKKNIVKIGLLSLLAFSGSTLLNSCRDAIYIEQDGEINSDVFFSNVTNLEKFLYGDVYMSADNTYGVVASSILSDEVSIGTDNGGNNVESYRHFIDSSNEFASQIWLDNYKLINRATRLIEGAKKITPASNEVSKYNNIIAQARVLRALAYLQLETYFSEDMTNDNALGVMIINDEVPTPSTKLPRSTNAQVYAVIESDLNLAESHLDQSSRYYVSKDVVNAIKARLNLYRGKYSDAKTYAQAVISNSGLSLTATPAITGTVGTTDFYKEESNNPYRQIWSDYTQGEVIFALARPVTGSYYNIGSYYNTNNSTKGGSPKWEMGRNLFNILEASTGDIRRYAFVDPTSEVNPNYLNATDRTEDILIIDKYPGKGITPTRNDIKVFRLSEMYLILAEAAAEEDDLVTAANYIGQIRTARNYLGTATTPSYTSKQEALADILKERRVELAFEGHRFIDLKRMATRAGVTMDRNTTDDDTGISVTNLPNGSYKYTLPIPASEIAGNKSIQQNTGY